jgi:hypothetical protein
MPHVRAMRWLVECLDSGREECCPFGQVAIVGDASARWCPKWSIRLNPINCHLVVQGMFGCAASITKRVRFPAATRLVATLCGF